MKVRISGLELQCDVNYGVGSENACIEMIVSPEESLTDEDILKIRDAHTLEELAYSYDSPPVVSGTYKLLGWRYIKQTRYGLCFGWQTYRTTDIDQLKQDNEDLTAALLELAEIVGGNNG